MTAHDQAHEAVSTGRHRARWLRRAGIFVLVLGLAGAGVVYWLGKRTTDLSDNPALSGFNKPVERQMRVLYGKQGQLIENLSNGLKQPGTQATIIVIVSGVVAFACFYFARIQDDKSESGD